METNEKKIKVVTYLGIVHQNRLLLVQYKVPPNPRRKSGWWIPAPEVGYGEDPKEKVQQQLALWNLQNSDSRLMDTESFVTPGGWHLLYHFHIKTTKANIIDANIESLQWVTKEELASMDDLAHGDWEKELGLSFLEEEAE